MKTTGPSGRGCALFTTLTALTWPIHAAEITTATTTPIYSSSAESGAPGNIRIASGGSIALSDGTYTTAVTIDSDHNLSSDGTVSVTNTNNAVGVQVLGGRLTSIYSNGAISLTEDYTRTDTDADGDADGAYASGTSRFGILVAGPAPMSGRIDLGPSGAISVEGNDSAGIRLDAALLGSLVNDGNIFVVGSNVLGIDLRGGMTANLLQSGTISVQGENATGVRILNVIDGAFTNEGTVVATGFASTVLTNYADPETVTAGVVPLASRIDAEDLLTGGPAVSIGASIRQGFLNNGIIDKFLDSTETSDTTKDTIEDFDANRSAGTISSYGSAPAITIAPIGGTGDLVIGTVVETVRDTTDDDGDTDTTETLATFNYDYGLINRGTISANGLNIGFSATALAIAGASDGSQPVVIDGGLLNSNTISATAYEANATALSLGPYVRTDRISNGGNITAIATTDTSHQATAILLAEQSSVGEIRNTGTITATTHATGTHGSAHAIVDRSGALHQIINQGTIAATLTVDAEDFISGDRVAIDVGGSTAPIVIDQSALTPVDDINGDGAINASDVAAPSILGDILLGSGDDMVSIRGGGVTADRVDLGAGSDSLLLSNGSVFSALLVHAEQVTVDNATLALAAGDPTMMSQLDVLGSAVLNIGTNVQTANLAEARLNIAGTARFDSSAAIKAELEGFTNSAVDIRLLQAGTLILSDASSQISVTVPVIYDDSIAIVDNAITLHLMPRNASDFGLNGNEATAFAAVLDAAARTTRFGSALSSYTATDALADDLPQLLPDYTGGSARMLAGEISLATGTIGTRLNQWHEAGAGDWFEMSLFDADGDTTADGVGYNGYGVSLQAGTEHELLDGWLAGLELALRNAQYDVEKKNDHEINWTGYDATLYSAYRFHALRLAATMAGGYFQGLSTRAVAFGGSSDSYDGAWHGYYVAGSSKLSWLASSGKYFLSPAATIDYFRLKQRAFDETSNDPNAVFGLAVGAAETKNLSSSLTLALGRRTGVFDTDGRATSVSDRGTFRRRARSGSMLQVYGGYHELLSSTPYHADVSFLHGSGAAFELQDLNAAKSAIIFGANYTSRSDNVFITIGYKGEIADNHNTSKLHAELRFSF